ncbi:MAG TPA: putative baseplate assembly protein [Longimicrobiales bacterium]
MNLTPDATLRGLDRCGACEGTAEATPAAIRNRPGLSAIAYRVGDHATFLRSMLAGLSSGSRPALRELATREGDFSIALLDAWAAVADVLTFYQERLANEAYLRTATEPGSVLELARAIGYRPSPGVAASAYLAFTLEDATGAPAAVTIEARTRVQSIPGPGEKPQTFETVEAIEARPEWNALRPRLTAPRLPALGDTSLYLQGVATNLRPGDAILIVGADRLGDPTSERWDFRRLTAVEPDPAAGVTKVTWAEGLGWRRFGRTILPADTDVKVYAFRQRAALFGASAPDWRSMPDELREEYAPADGATEWPRFSISGINAAVGAPEDSVHLDATYPRITPGSWVVLSIPNYEELYRVKEVEETAVTDFTLTGKVTRLRLSGENLTETFDDAIRAAVVFAVSEELALAEAPIDDAVQGDTVVAAVRADGLEPGRRLIVTGRPAGARDGAVASEVVELLEAVAVDDAHTTLRFATPLSGVYDRSTVTIHANVALATHGETTTETLGSGDAATAYQRFTLRQAPLTYVTAATESGRASTLEVRVRDVAWTEVPTLFGRGPHERVFTTFRRADGTTEVQFGDGRTGARPVTGAENITATYRKGLGREGNVGAGQLSLLMTRPLGVKAVTNPLPASGGEDPETLEDTREAAPLTVLTLGRIVSLDDYRDFARTFAGIRKAHAAWTWNGRTRGIFLTVAGPAGDAVPDGGPVQSSLLDAIARSGDPHIPVQVRSYEPVPFRVAATVTRDAAYRADDVRAAVEAALADRFSFEAREFGQPVALSEVMGVIQAVEGVVAVDVDALHAIGGETGFHSLLEAHLPAPGEDARTVRPAQLLVIRVSPGDITVVP